jgi:hypothetical protein
MCCMKRRTPVSVYIVTALLVFYTILIALNAPLWITGLLFFLSPFFMTWMVVCILKSKNHNVKDFAADEEWGYADKKKEELDMF